MCDCSNYVKCFFYEFLNCPTVHKKQQLFSEFRWIFETTWKQLARSQQSSPHLQQNLADLLHFISTSNPHLYLYMMQLFLLSEVYRWSRKNKVTKHTKLMLQKIMKNSPFTQIKHHDSQNKIYFVFLLSSEK